MNTEKRLLTCEEIEYLLDFIKVDSHTVPTEISLSVVNKIKEAFRKQLQGQLIYPEILETLKKEIEKNYRSSLVQPGESVGILCAASIGEQHTQINLSSFHKAGQAEKSIVTGVPRIQELLNATKEPKSVASTIFFKDKISSVGKLRKKLGNSLVSLNINDIISNISVQEKKQDWYSVFKNVYPEEYQDIKNKYLVSNSKYISIEFNLYKLYEYKLDLQHIANNIKNNTDCLCIPSPLSIGIIDVFVDIPRDEEDENVIIEFYDDREEEIFFEKIVIPELKKIYVCGIEGIKEIYYQKKGDEWIVETNGSNIKELLNHPLIDNTRTYSNNVWDIYRTLGIEAVRQFMIEEYTELMEGINRCHIELLVDRMTYLGTISSITRFTLRKEDIGPLSKSSFEESLDVFLKSAASGEYEPTIGVSASITCGKRANIGTGMMDIIMDLDNM